MFFKCKYVGMYVFRYVCIYVDFYVLHHSLNGLKDFNV